MKSSAEVISDLTPKNNDHSAKKNPFKVAAQKTPASGKGSKVFDSIERKSRTSAAASPFESVQKKTKITKSKKRVRLPVSSHDYPVYTFEFIAIFSQGASPVQQRLFGKTIDSNQKHSS